MTLKIELSFILNHKFDSHQSMLWFNLEITLADMVLFEYMSNDEI